MAGIDLTGARETFEELVMADECVIARDAFSKRDAILNDETGVLVDDPPVVVYTGKCSGRQLGDQDDTIANGPKLRKTVKVNIPWDSPEVKIGDMVVFTTSRDPRLVGPTLYVNDVVWGTNQVARKLTCVRRVDGVDRR